MLLLVLAVVSAPAQVISNNHIVGTNQLSTHYVTYARPAISTLHLLCSNLTVNQLLQPVNILQQQRTLIVHCCDGDLSPGKTVQGAEGGAALVRAVASNPYSHNCRADQVWSEHRKQCVKLMFRTAAK